MIITISGKPGSGKTSIGNLIAAKLGYKFYSLGDLRGKMAVEKGMTINELNKIGENASWTDMDIDDYQKEMGKKEDNMIIEGRLSFHFIPHSIKIFLDVDSTTGAERIFKDQREDEEKVNTLKEMQEMIQKRMESDKKRYAKYYKIDCYNQQHYDLAINTTNHTISEVVQKVLDHIQKV